MSRFAQRAEKELQATLAEKDPTFRDIDHLVAQYRSKCENVIFQDFDFATSKNVEARLWDAHVKINNRFRKNLSRVSGLCYMALFQTTLSCGQFHDEDNKRRPVEKRKTVKHYLDFIKSSQRFYRGFIQRLSSHFGNIPELLEVAHRCNLDTLSVEISAHGSPHLRQLVLLSCHQSLVRLGDLSRYRETELVTKDRNWGPAIGYYDLAGTIYPVSGASHNQLAVIALADGNHLRATYHLYRALAVEEPHQTAKRNLEIEFKKILAAWDKGELISKGPARDGSGADKAFLGWFMRLHARCYKGIEFTEHDELENEVLSQLAVDLKERSLEDDPKSRDNFQAFFFFQRLNVKTFFTFLQILQPELERFAGEESTAGDVNGPSKGLEKVTAVARRILPALRHYSSWLVSNAALLIAEVGDTSLNVQIKELWKIYANTLTLLAATFPVSELPNIEYLLEEDVDTLGFKPFTKDRTWKRYFHDERQESRDRKSKWNDRGVERHHPNVEMLGRIRDFLIDGLTLATDESIPLNLVHGTAQFTYQEEGLPSELLASPSGHQATLSSTSIEREDIPKVNGHANKSAAPDALSTIDDQTSQSASMNTAMNHMVDNIVGSEADECATADVHYNENIPPTPPGHTFDDDSSMYEPGNDISYGLMGTLTAQDFVAKVHAYSQSPTHSTNRSTPRPVLPSVLNSAFAPQPGEVSPQTRPSTANRVSPTPPSQFSLQPQSVLQNGYSVQSSISSMQQPSSLAYPYSPLANNGFGQLLPNVGNTNGFGTVRGRPSTVYGGGSIFDDSNLMLSAGIFDGSEWRGSGLVNTHTPPNGQGGG
ncbi:MAG: hypothetical protein M1830_004909 [Pleopsidium flavum]|nr:MAG: hypothetical protein M1830_004909 [Pleopsidium flavum]